MPISEKAARIAELERKIAELEAANEATPTWGWGAAVGARWESIKGLRAELARLRNESPALTSEPVGADHKSIWLSPVCNNEHCDNCRDDRAWHEDRLPVCDECGLGPTEYVRAALYASPPPLPAGNADPRVREALIAALVSETVSVWYDESVIFKQDRLRERFGKALVLASTQSQGLVEAADICRELYQTNFTSASPSELLLLTEAERLIRSRASDRSA